MLRRFRDVNAEAFEKLRTSEEVVISSRRSVPKDSTLSELARAGLRQEIDAPVVLSAIIKELQNQSE